MKNTRFKISIILLIIGFILIALDFNVKTGFSYPNDYENSDKVIGEFQYYNIASNYGATCTYKLIDASDDSKNIQNNQTEQSTLSTASASMQTKVIDKVFFDRIHIDVFNDWFGFLLIAISCFILRPVSSRFRFGALSAISGMVLYTILQALPFIVNGLSLCNISMFIGIAYLSINVLTVFLCVNGLLLMCPDICCRDERKWCKIIWFIIFVLQILVTFVLWLGSDFDMLKNLGRFFEFVLILMIVIFWLILKRVITYIEATYEHALDKK